MKLNFMSRPAKMKYLLTFIVLSLFGFYATAQNQIHRVEGSPYPASSKPDTLYVISDDSFSHEELLLIQSIQGLCAKTKPALYRDKGSGSSIWIQDIQENYGVYVSNSMDGYILSLIHI